jgi:hypothetical protein
MSRKREEEKQEMETGKMKSVRFNLPPLRGQHDKVTYHAEEERPKWNGSLRGAT